MEDEQPKEPVVTGKKKKITGAPTTFRKSEILIMHKLANDLLTAVPANPIARHPAFAGLLSKLQRLKEKVT